MDGFTQVPKDLTKIKSKLIFNLTKRQLICFGCAVIIGLPTYFFTKGIVGNSAAVLLMIGLMLPFFLLAMFERDGLPAEIILRNMLRVKLWRGKRLYKTQNIFSQNGGDVIDKKAKK